MFHLFICITFQHARAETSLQMHTNNILDKSQNYNFSPDTHGYRLTIFVEWKMQSQWRKASHAFPSIAKLLADMGSKENEFC